jgi:predicted sulfurtransferase
MKKTITKLVPFLVVTAFFLSGYAQAIGKTTSAVEPTAAIKEKATESVYKGRVVGKSNKAKTISIQVGKGAKAQTIMVKFDENTKGTEYATKGHGVIISYEQQGKDLYARSIKPKLSKMPKGVTGIKTAKLKAMIDSGKDFVLVDSRPSTRYGQGHLPGAISIPVCEMQELIGLLPTRHPEFPIVFYCGGPT